MQTETVARMNEVERLHEIARKDPTVKMFLDCWRSGHFKSFESMVCQMAVQLATEKQIYMRSAVANMQSVPFGSFVIPMAGGDGDTASRTEQETEDGSYVCSSCYAKGLRGHMQKMQT